MDYVVLFDFSSNPMKSVRIDNHDRPKRALSSDSNITNKEEDLSIKNYFINRHCIRYGDIQQPFRFNEQPGQIDLSGKLRIIVSIDSLNSLTNRYEGKTYRSFPLYFLIVS
jgi:hypothetical protein